MPGQGIAVGKALSRIEFWVAVFQGGRLMRGVVHCLGLALLLSGGLGLIGLAAMALQVLETAFFQARPVIATEFVRQPESGRITPPTLERVPFVLMP